MHKFERSLPTVEVEASTYDPALKKETKTKVRVPINPDKFVSTKEEFELTYMRWRYFMRASNPPEELIKKYEKAAYKIAKETYNENFETMKNSGLEVEDVCNIALVHLVSYLGCYSLQFSDNGKLKIEEKKKKMELAEEEIKRKDLSNMMVFIQQRMKDLIRVFRQKNKNVFGENLVAVLFQLVDREKPCTDLELLKAPDKYGYRRVLPSQYKEVKKKLGGYPTAGKFVIGDISYRYVHVYSGPVWISDHENADDISAFNPQSDESYQEYNTELSNRFRMERILEKYQKATPKNKARMLERAMFIFRKKRMIKELALANRLFNKISYT